MGAPLVRGEQRLHRTLRPRAHLLLDVERVKVGRYPAQACAGLGLGVGVGVGLGLGLGLGSGLGLESPAQAARSDVLEQRRLALTWLGLGLGSNP